MAEVMAWGIEPPTFRLGGYLRKMSDTLTTLPLSLATSCSEAADLRFHRRRHGCPGIRCAPPGPLATLMITAFKQATTISGGRGCIKLFG